MDSFLASIYNSTSHRHVHLILRTKGQGLSKSFLGLAAAAVESAEIPFEIPFPFQTAKFTGLVNCLQGQTLVLLGVLLAAKNLQSCGSLKVRINRKGANCYSLHISRMKEQSP
jgi:hypothetical protein